jgi:hypothetical protein
VIEAEFRYQFLHNTSGVQTNAEVYFIALNGSDPSPGFLSRFKDVRPDVKSASEAGRDKAKGDRIIESKTGKKGLLFTHMEIKWVTHTKAEVICVMSEANQSRSVKRLTLERIEGRWVVTRDELLAIS